MANTSIKFRDSQNWTRVDGVIIDQSILSTTFKDERLEPAYLPPEIVTDIWNGEKHDVQHIRHDAWRFEFIGRESELQKLSTMQSCDIIFIEDIDNGLNHTVDMQVSEWLSFGEPERQADTTNWRLVLEYRTNKTIINKFDGLDDQVVLVGGDGTYNSKYEKISYDGELEEIRVQWGEGGEKLLQETNNVGFKILLYLNDGEKEIFKNDWNQNTFTIDGTPIIRKLLLEIVSLGEDNYQIIISCITIRQTIDITATLPNVVALAGGVSTYFSKFVKTDLINPPEEITIEWTDGFDRLLRQTYKSGFNVLLYLDDNSLSAFLDDYNTNSFTIDTAKIFEKKPAEVTELSSGLYQIIIKVVTNIDIKTYDLTPLNTHELIITDSGTFTFHTDYATQPSVDDTENSDFDNESGVDTTAQSISRERTDIKLFLNTADKNSLKLHFERGTATIDAVTILQKEIISESELGFDLWEVNINALITATVTHQL